MRRAWIGALVTVIVLLGASTAWAEGPELDPLLELLVKRGLITQEEAVAVQAEYDRRDAEAPEAVADKPMSGVNSPEIRTSRPRTSESRLATVSR